MKSIKGKKNRKTPQKNRRRETVELNRKPTTINKYNDEQREYMRIRTKNKRSKRSHPRHHQNLLRARILEMLSNKNKFNLTILHRSVADSRDPLYYEQKHQFEKCTKW